MTVTVYRRSCHNSSFKSSRSRLPRVSIIRPVTSSGRDIKLAKSQFTNIKGRKTVAVVSGVASSCSLLYISNSRSNRPFFLYKKYIWEGCLPVDPLLAYCAYYWISAARWTASPTWALGLGRHDLCRYMSPGNLDDFLRALYTGWKCRSALQESFQRSDDHTSLLCLNARPRRMGDVWKDQWIW